MSQKQQKNYWVVSKKNKGKNFPTVQRRVLKSMVLAERKIMARIQNSWSSRHLSLLLRWLSFPLSFSFLLYFSKQKQSQTKRLMWWSVWFLQIRVTQCEQRRSEDPMYSLSTMTEENCSFRANECWTFSFMKTFKTKQKILWFPVSDQHRN